ncbi:uncharacterized protein TNCV_217391 [Trichonephila clavipes]|nr:uncharacterized protein TNCV_217391 [Trichonephila clavipes]
MTCVSIFHWTVETGKDCIYLSNARAWLLDHLTPSHPVPTDDVISRLFIESSALELVVVIHSGMAAKWVGLVSSHTKPEDVYSQKVLSDDVLCSSEGQRNLVPTDETIRRVFIEGSALELLVVIHSGMAAKWVGLVSNHTKPEDVYSQKHLSGSIFVNVFGEDVICSSGGQRNFRLSQLDSLLDFLFGSFIAGDPKNEKTVPDRLIDGILTSHCSVTRGLLVTDRVILNHSQVMWTTPELAPPSPNYHTIPTGGHFSSRQI